jgi:hypothetical protein
LVITQTFAGQRAWPILRRWQTSTTKPSGAATGTR